MKASVIIPTYNEEKVIKDCIKSLEEQTFKNFEVIIVDDGSTDRTWNIVNSLKSLFINLKSFQQKHLGPGIARNLGSKYATGEVLVFVDADMTFDKNFIKNLINPIIQKTAVVTFSKVEFVLNKDNIWSKCWNINKGLPLDRMHPKNYPDTQPVFRAILKKEFDKAGGFKPIGYIDDYTLSEKLGVHAVAAPGAIFYHKNPDNLFEIFNQARWVGKSEYKRRKIKNENLMRFVALVRYSFLFSIIHGLLGALKHNLPHYLIFKIIYDFATEVSLIGSFFGEQKYK